ncbi:tetratricopeptide repeat protein [Calidifontimicrobium sp. SYSU G02091]|uniref:YfgM family protein n=1 Tax=Calidifontimicrobium sp. SYSU G02091 TaxID=2926421 RepID=UPI001F53C7A8|nr:tetratricopeptide repeat protein [Calidifontimicrobium sp. SYSU G02091]MCI1192002.1 tetratricopeptide repeat protein [Calidifontimicrobium sp. SYSU G02091]
MATPLDLQEQEQLDALKAFWKRYGNLITWTLMVALGSYAGWNGWTWYQRGQSMKAAAMFDELERAAHAGDAARVARVFDDLKQRYASTAYAEKGGLLAARVQFEQQQRDAGRAALQWVADHAAEDEYRAIARLRLAGVLLDDGKPDEALKLLDTVKDAAFAALVADRRGDALMALGRRDDAKAAYQAAWRAMDASVEYRQLVEAKLTALGAAPAADGAAR